MPTELEEVCRCDPMYTSISANIPFAKLVDFISHGNTQVRQLGRFARPRVGQNKRHQPSVLSYTLAYLACMGFEGIERKLGSNTADSECAKLSGAFMINAARRKSAD